MREIHSLFNHYNAILSGVAVNNCGYDSRDIQNFFKELDIDIDISQYKIATRYTGNQLSKIGGIITIFGNMDDEKLEKINKLKTGVLTEIYRDQDNKIQSAVYINALPLHLLNKAFELSDEERLKIAKIIFDSFLYIYRYYTNAVCRSCDFLSDTIYFLPAYAGISYGYRLIYKASDLSEFIKYTLSAICFLQSSNIDFKESLTELGKLIVEIAPNDSLNAIGLKEKKIKDFLQDYMIIIETLSHFS